MARETEGKPISASRSKAKPPVVNDAPLKHAYIERCWTFAGYDHFHLSLTPALPDGRDELLVSACDVNSLGSDSKGNGFLFTAVNQPDEFGDCPTADTTEVYGVLIGTDLASVLAGIGYNLVHKGALVEGILAKLTPTEREYLSSHTLPHN